MKIVEVKCQECEAGFETLDVFPQKDVKCPACGTEKLIFTETNKEFTGCGGSCDDCSSCE